MNGSEALLIDRLVRQMAAVPGLKLLIRQGRGCVTVESVRDQDLMSLPEIARMLKVSVATVRRRWVDTGRLRPAVGRKYSRADVMRLLDERGAR